MNTFQKPLFIFEMANNHQGSVEHGKRIIDAMWNCAAHYREKFSFAVKFQYRDLDTFIHPAMRNRMDVKNIKRFQDTRLSNEEFGELLTHVRKRGFVTICTPFDEHSALRIKQEGYDYIKIASCSFGDWPLMEAVAETALPVIASAAGSDVDIMHKVVSFFSNRKISISLMHCVGEYPTPPENLRLGQIDFLRREFPDITIGFSTHEAPGALDPVKIAVAKGARIFEKHVGLPTETITLNGYSAAPEQIKAWLEAADATFTLCGDSSLCRQPSDKEAKDLAALRRGAFVKNGPLQPEYSLGSEDVYFAFPCQPGQLIAQDFSKYARMTLRTDMDKDAPVMAEQVAVDYKQRVIIAAYMKQVVGLLKASNAVVPTGSTCDFSHHYGLERFHEVGLTLIDCVNREYCKKLLVLLPGQSHPAHHHIKKEETFIVVHGDLIVCCDDTTRTLRRGETMTLERHTPHSFSSVEGCIFEEISSTHCSEDSYYEASATFVRPRKTRVFLTKDVLG